MADVKQAVVIGSGFGGLAAAVRLGARGYRVTVVEKLEAPGGRASVFRQDGYTFDAGPTIITAPYLFEELWTLCGRRMADDVDVRPVNPFYVVRFDDGTEIAYSDDADDMRRQIGAISPRDVEGFDRFMEVSAEIYEVAFAELADQPFHEFSTMLRCAYDLLRLEGHRSVHGKVSKYFRDERLRILFSFHPLLIGGNPLSVTCIYSLINTLERRYGVHSAMGGTGAIVRAMVRLLESVGGQIRYNAEVSRIDVEPDAQAKARGKGRATGVTLASGERIASDIVVCNGDTMWTYKNLIEPRWRKRWTDRRIEDSRHSMSLFVWYFGTNKRYEDVPHHMMVLGPRYDELLRDIFKRHKLADDFSLYLHRPTATDPALAPPGCDAFYVLSPVPHLASGTDWAQHAEPYRQAVQEALERTVLPQLGQHIVTSRMTTPQDFHDRLLSYKGAAFGQEPLLLQSAWFRAHNRSEDVDGLYMVGAGTHPGAGVPGVLMSAKTLEQVIPHVSTFA